MKIELNIDEEHIINMLEDANIGYWGVFESYVVIGEMIRGTKPYLIVTERYDHTYTGNGDEPPKEHKVHRIQIAQAIQTISVKWPHHLKGIMDEYDDVTGDVLIQVAIFGDIIYG